ncbi:MAG: hypothetical protein DRR11_10165 [Gammaproteobacteria bacterium]|nr:MAG: hypothetical protein DRR11_10165 [Gammaproteobacteria bacterium]
MTETNINSIVIAGGGAAGATVAAALAVSLQGSATKIKLIQPPVDGGNAPCEAVRGGAQSFHQMLGVAEQELLAATRGGYGLGTRFQGFHADHEEIFLPLGSHGMTLRLIDFHHYAAKLRNAGASEEYNEYSLSAAAAGTGRFSPPGDSDNPASKTLAYDIYVDAGHYAMFWQNCAEDLGVEVLTAKMEAAVIGADRFIESVSLEDGNGVDGDFFIDCSSDRVLAGCLDEADAFDDWSRWLPCDQFVSALTKKSRQPLLFMDIEANDYGWVQNTTLSNLAVHNLACSSQHIDAGSAQRLLQEKLGDVTVFDIQTKTQCAGNYHNHWVNNCVAIGPAALSIEPMEISSLQLVHSAVLRLLGMLPDEKFSPALAQEYNRVTNEECASARDYIILHYMLAGRRSSPFWAQFNNVTLPDSLQARVELFKTHGRITNRDYEFVSGARWASCFLNFGAWPSSYDPIADMIDEKRMQSDVSKFHENVQQIAESF